MFDRIPFRGTGWIVRHRNGQVEFIGELLQVPLPEPTMIAIRTAAIGEDEYFRLAAMVLPTYLQPPTTNGSHGEGRGFMGRARHDIAFVASQIINAVGNRFPFRIVWKVGLKNIERCATPRPSWIFEDANQLFFLRIYAYYWQFCLDALAA